MGFRKGWGSDENRALGALLIGQTGKAEVLGHEKELPEGRPLQESLLLGQHCDFVCVCVSHRDICKVQHSDMGVLLTVL